MRFQVKCLRGTLRKTASANPGRRWLSAAGSRHLKSYATLSSLATRYHAVVKLRLVFADSQRGRILHTTTIESTSGLEHFRCTQEGMQEQINSALSLALEKILDNSELDNALREVGSVRDESLAE